MSEQLSETQQPVTTVVFRFDPAVDVSQNVDDQLWCIFDDSVLTSFHEEGGIIAELSQSPLEGLSYRAFIERLNQHSNEEAFYTIGQQLKAFIGSGYLTNTQTLQRTIKGQIVSFSVELQALRCGQQLQELRVLIVDNTDVRSRDDLVFSIAQGLSTASGEQFFPHLAEYLAGTLGLDFVSIAKASHEDQLTNIAFYNRGELSVEASVFNIQGPFHNHHNRIVCYPEHVVSLFPEASWLVEEQVQAFMSVPLYSSEGDYLGVIALMHRQEFANIELLRSLLTIFSVRAAAELELQEQKRGEEYKQNRYSALIESTPNGIVVLDVNPPLSVELSIREQVKHLVQHARYAECNPAFLHIHGLKTPADLIGRALGEVDVIADFAGQMREFVFKNYLTRDRATKVFTQSGDEFWLSKSLTGHIENGYLKRIFGVCTDVSEQVRQTQLLARQANHDELTQLPNRGFFKQSVEQIISELEEGEKAAVFILDLDGFKEINDTLGHITGDLLLQMVGPRIRKVLDDDSVILARLGGDEFGFLIQNPGSDSDLIDRALLLMSAIKTPFPVNELDLCVGGSVGISLYPEHGKDFSALMRCADVAMYRAKDQSRDIEIYDPAHDHYSVRRLSLMMDLRSAIDDEQLILHYQPIIDLADSSVHGFEALVRWQHPVHGMLPPGEFIPLIELTDVIDPLTWWVIETAIKQLQEWQSQGLDYCLSVNVSTRNIADDSFVYRLSRLLRKYKVDGRKLEMEITESTLMADPVKGRSVLTAMAAMGVLFAIDDFGTGYSSLAYLKSLPINTLKIDRAFISQMLESPQDEVIVNSTIQLAHNLGMKVTAEGIENGLLLEELAKLGCDRGQGFFICRPMPLTDLNSWVSLYERGSQQAKQPDMYIAKGD